MCRTRFPLGIRIVVAGLLLCVFSPAYSQSAGLVNNRGWFVQGDTVIWGWVQHNGWWRGGQRANLTRRSVGDPLGDLRPNRTEDLDALTDSMLRYAYPAFEHNYGLWYDRRRDAHDTAPRSDPNVVPPFLEQPWARSDSGTASDGLHRYDLATFNPWYFERLCEFAELCDRKGAVLIHKFYMQHALLETPAHYVDFPWRPGNCIQDTGLPDAIPAANIFYDVTHPVRREMHRLYIRQCLDVLGNFRNVIHLTSQEFTGPTDFVLFWLDEIRAWEKETGKQVCIGLGAPKDVQDAVLARPEQAKNIEVLDLRYWWLNADGNLVAAQGGQEIPGRGLESGAWQAEQSPPERIYAKIRAIREQYPSAGILDAIEATRQQSWAFLMGGGGLLVRGQISYPDFADPPAYIQPAEVDVILPTYNWIRSELVTQLCGMRPADVVISSTGPTWCLAGPTGPWLVYALEGGRFSLTIPAPAGKSAAIWFDPRTGSQQEALASDGAETLTFEAPSSEDWALYLPAPR
jgi:hypothetical protein